jgi:DNA-binding HxlR family transcriptional regulator
VRKPTSTNARNEAELVARCPLAAALRLVGGRWKLMLLWYVEHGVARYGRLRETIPHITDKMLYQQLRELERDGLLSRARGGAAGPRAVTYELTALGHSLVPLLAELARWSEAHRVGERLAGERPAVPLPGDRSSGRGPGVPRPANGRPAARGAGERPANGRPAARGAG